MVASVMIDYFSVLALASWKCVDVSFTVACLSVLSVKSRLQWKTDPAAQAVARNGLQTAQLCPGRAISRLHRSVASTKPTSSTVTVLHPPPLISQLLY